MEMVNIFREAIIHKGFAVVEVLSQCPTYYGRKNKLGSAVDMMKAFKEGTAKIGSKKKEENPDLIERGVFVKEKRFEYTSDYKTLVEQLHK
jgi:2-oxoglutarate ferredoxin oxidoreductase subunit beta